MLSFPSFDQALLAWVGLFPLLLTLKDKSLRYGFILSLVCGILFFLGIFHWILDTANYTLLHHGLLALYLGSYFGLFGLAFTFISKHWGALPALLAAPFVWVSLEFIRSNFGFLAFPWALLAHSQYQYPRMIQIASFAGTYSVSFMIVLVNAAIASLVIGIGQQKKPLSSAPWKAQGRFALVIPAALLLLLTLLYGHVALTHTITGNKIKIALVQGNIEQAMKWDPRYAGYIMQTYTELTRQVSLSHPSLIIWPETSTPGSISLDLGLYAKVKEIAGQAATYLLLGSAHHQKFEKKGVKEFHSLNSAYLIYSDSAITIRQRYDKIRLFPFGEYTPYRERIPWALINVGDSDHYLPGKEFTIFSLPPFRFGTTICWENIFPNLVRQFVKRGAQFIVNITNEARFGKTAAPYQLASISVFRAVENGIFVIRCANTGVSCIIDPYGRIIERLRDENGQDTFVRGKLTGWIIPLDSETIYTRYGDWFVWVIFAGTAVSLSLAFWKWHKR